MVENDHHLYFVHFDGQKGVLRPNHHIWLVNKISLRVFLAGYFVNIWTTRWRKQHIVVRHSQKIINFLTSLKYISRTLINVIQPILKLASPNPAKQLFSKLLWHLNIVISRILSRSSVVLGKIGYLRETGLRKILIKMNS